MVNKIRQIFSHKLRLSGIRGCMAAGAMTAGIAALAVIGGVNSEDISTVSLETDVIPEEAVTEKAEKKTYSHDMEYFSLEDIKKMTSEEDVSEAEEMTEAAVPAESAPPVSETAPEEPAENIAPEEPETAPEEYAAEEEESVPESDETASEEEETDDEKEAAYDGAETAYEEITESTEEASDNTSDETEQNEEDDEEESSSEQEKVSARLSAAGGNDDDSGLSSALDLETEDSSEAMEASNASETTEANEAPKASETDDYIIIYSETEETVINTVSELPAAAASSEEDMNALPEDITLDDEAEAEDESTPAPQDGAISLLELPEWLEFDENGLPKDYVNVLTGNACAYTAEPDALMSTGKAVFQGYVAVDPDIIPYGTELYIVAEDGEVYGYAIAADTGYSVRKGHIIVDLFMNEYDDCIQWGNKPVYVYILK